MVHTIAIAAGAVLFVSVVLTGGWGLVEARRGRQFRALYEALISRADREGGIPYAVPYWSMAEASEEANMWLQVPGTTRRKTAMIAAGLKPVHAHDPNVQALSDEELAIMAALVY